MSDTLFTEMPSYGCHETAHLGDFELRLTWEYDSTHEAPWDAEDGHGPVSDWRRRNYMGHFDKAPGERLLHSDGGNLYTGSARFYDFAEACRIARRDGWRMTGDEDLPARDRAANAAEADFQRLKDWCEDRWHYLGLTVTAYKGGVELGSASLWGIESDAGGYLFEVADDLADDATAEAKAKLAELCECV